ncbi:MAG: hypothetical protein SFW36_06050 [Leptolyngbyaceae cyanobacterium bins.59]|nr:hypothetical protein [Leptolyngbyaceae cyanobacterium bins.59]
MNEWLKLWPWVIVALIPGEINLMVAFKQLADDCKFLPFFEPYQSWGVWWWSLVQLASPSLLFWMMANLGSKPAIDYDLITQAIGFGIGFVTVLNSRTDTGFFTLNLKIVYARFVAVAYALIASKETRRTAAFWTDVERQLNLATDLSEGLDFLENYFRTDVSLTPEEKANRQQRLVEVRQKASRPEQAEAILALMDVRRRDLPDVLQRFQATPELLKKYFPRSQVYARY